VEDSVAPPPEVEPPVTGSLDAAAQDGAGQDGEAQEGQWVFMVDPAWQPPNEGDDPPVEAVVGGWWVDPDGATGLFRPNPSYQPSQEDYPTDPVDAALQLVVRGEADGDELLASMHEIMLGVALDEDGDAVVAPAPDDSPSLLVTTAPAHRARVHTDNWAEVTVAELAESLPDEGLDVLINPGAPASMRLLASAVKRSVQDVAEQAATDNDPANAE
jgi:hypothetical protein